MRWRTGEQCCISRKPNNSRPNLDGPVPSGPRWRKDDRLLHCSPEVVDMSDITIAPGGYGKPGGMESVGATDVANHLLHGEKANLLVLQWCWYATQIGSREYKSTMVTLGSSALSVEIAASEKVADGRIIETESRGMCKHDTCCPLVESQL